MVENSYKELKEIYRKIGDVAFNVAVSILMENGFNLLSKCTEEDILEAEVPNLFDETYYRNILRAAKDISLITEPIDLIIFCMTDSRLDSKHFSNKLSYVDLDEMIRHRLEYEEYGFNRNEEIDYLCGRYGCDAEDFEMLGYKIPEHYFE